MNVAQLGFVQSDVMSYAYNGERLFEGFPYADFSTVAALYMEQVQIVTCDPGHQVRGWIWRARRSPSAPLAPACTTTPWISWPPMT